MKIFAFDMDGVVVDTIAGLYGVYLEFLREFGKSGSPEEFDKLNGPSLREVVSILKTTHGLADEHAALLTRYQDKVARLYDQVQLIDGAGEVLAAARAEGHKVALVSSAPRQAINIVLNKYGLRFDAIVSGDDVKEAKPSPAIYEQVKQVLDGEFVAIEDATLGIESALAAGFKVIAFGNRHPEAAFEVDSMREVLDLVRGYRIFRGAVELVLVDHPPEIRGSRDVDRVWAERNADGNLFDGPMLAYVDHATHGGTLKVRCFLSSYRFFVAGAIAPLSVSGITTDASGRTLVGQRGEVTEYPGRCELVPSGSLEDTDYHRQILKELREEAGIAEGAVETLGLLHDTDHDVYDVACRITVADFDTRANGEYERLEAVTELDETDLIPPSAALRAMAREDHGG